MAGGSPKCGGKKRQGEGTCTRPAGWGTSHPGYGRCKLHGGSTPTVAKAALEQAIQDQAASELAKLDIAPVANPLAELQILAGQAVAWKNAMAAKVNQLADISYRPTLGQEQLRSELTLWERAMDRCPATLTALAKLDIDERLVRIEEAKAAMVAAAVRDALAKAGATEAQQLEAKQRVVRGCGPWMAGSLQGGLPVPPDTLLAGAADLLDADLRAAPQRPWRAKARPKQLRRHPPSRPFVLLRALFGTKRPPVHVRDSGA